MDIREEISHEILDKKNSFLILPNAISIPSAENNAENFTVIQTLSGINTRWIGGNLYGTQKELLSLQKTQEEWGLLVCMLP